MKNFLLKNILIACLFCVVCTPAISQDSSHLRVSLLTCTPGDELYSLFGHSAIRIIDSSSVQDNVFNYGTFNFDDKNFYLKFIRGKLLYYISTEPSRDFIEYYKMTDREITEQVLSLSASEKISLYHKLLNNLKEENKYYQYDFFFDNCTTRLRDLIVSEKDPPLVLPPVKPMNSSFRNAIHEYLDKGKQYWSKLGIDILLGARTDHKMTASEQEFLPNNLMNALAKQGPEIIKSQTKLYNLNPEEKKEPWFTPMFLSMSILALFVLLGQMKNHKLKIVLNGLDGLLFFFAGLIGCILIFMWFYTNHSMTKTNYNLLWAWPTHIITSFFISNKGKALHVYWLLTMVLLTVVLITWFFLPQAMNPALLPFVILMIYRATNKFFQR